MPFPVDIKFVNETERKLGVTFPPAFVAKMCAANGGEVEAADDSWQLYPFLDKSDRKRLARTCNDIVHETNEARTSSTFPANAIAIGGNGGGDQLVLLPLPNQPEILGNEIFWWDHETGELQKLTVDFAELV